MNTLKIVALRSRKLVADQLVKDLSVFRKGEIVLIEVLKPSIVSNNLTYSNLCSLAVTVGSSSKEIEEAISEAQGSRRLEWMGGEFQRVLRVYNLVDSEGRFLKKTISNSLSS